MWVIKNEIMLFLEILTSFLYMHVNMYFNLYILYIVLEKLFHNYYS